MRLAFVSPSYPPSLGGIPTVVSELAKSVTQLGHEVVVFTHRLPHSAPLREERDGILIRRFPAYAPAPELAMSPELLRALLRSRREFDVVHAHNFHASPPLLTALAGLHPLVLTAHYHGVAHTRLAQVLHSVYRPFARAVFAACDHVVCVSAAEAELLRADFRIRRPVSIVPNAVATAEWRDAEPLNCPGPVVLTAGRLAAYKQADAVVRAAYELPENIETVVLGDGPTRPALEAFIASRSGTQRVRLLGRLDDADVRRWFKTASVLVTMSRHESFGLTVQEALAAGTSVVASDIPAHREAMQKQPAGAIRLLSPDATTYELSEAISAAIAQGLPDGVIVRSWEDAAQELLGVYREVRARPRRRSRSWIAS